MHNASPPFAPPYRQPSRTTRPNDPRCGYYTRWAGNSLAVFLPQGAEVKGQATIRGVPFKPIVRSVLDRPYFYRKVLLEPGGQAVLTVTLPGAGRRHRRRRLADLRASTSTRSPPSTPRRSNVTLHLPEGYGLSPAGGLVR